MSTEDMHSNFPIPLVYDAGYDIKFWGFEKLHPFDSRKYGRVFKKLKQAGCIHPGKVHRPTKVSRESLQQLHTASYLASLNVSRTLSQIAEIPPLRYLPTFLIRRQLLKPMQLATGGTLLGAKLAVSEGCAINLSGGYHHASRDRGWGFCFYSDIGLAGYQHLEAGGKKVMVIDLDVHQGDGFERIFGDDPRFVTFDVYNGHIFPQDHVAQYFIKYDYPLPGGITDKEYLGLLHRELPGAIAQEQPDLIIYNAGTDIFKEDPLGDMQISKKGIMARDLFVFETALAQQIPILMLLSGGYSPESAGIIADSIINLMGNLGKKPVSA